MKSASVLQAPTWAQQSTLRADHQNNHIDHVNKSGEEEQQEEFQRQRQSFDMAIEEALEGLEEAQKILRAIRCSSPAQHISLKMRLKLHQTSHHCNRIIAEVRQILQPFSLEMQALTPVQTNKASEAENTSKCCQSMNTGKTDSTGERSRNGASTPIN